MYNQAQLEQAGFEPTPLELSVFNNPSFQFLRERNWPIRWGELTTGLSVKVEDFKLKFQPSDQQGLLPSPAGKLFDEFAPHLRSLIILSAVITRDATDHDLILALSSWLDGIDSYYRHPFRWDKFERDHEEELKRTARMVKVAGLSQGFASIVVLPLGELSHSYREIVRKSVMTGCIEREIFVIPDGYTSHDYHFPWPRCEWCAESKRDCRSPNSVVLIDCGDVPTIIKSLPPDVRRAIKPIRFKVPKSAFVDNNRCADASLAPRLLVFSLQLLPEKEQREFQSELEQGLQLEQGEAVQRGYGELYAKCRVIAPDGRQKLNALLLAGGVSRSDNWRHFFEKSDLLSRLGRTFEVDLIGGY